MTLDYAAVNKAILDGRDIDERVVSKNDDFYTYLLNNKVAYYYASVLSTRPTPAEARILEKGKYFQARYEKTMQLIQKVCSDNNIPYLLYKTHKYIPGMMDGDIDLLVSKEHFDRFLQYFTQLGFKTAEDEPGKGKCEHPDYCLIEPHTNVSWQGGEYLKDNLLWANPRQVSVGGQRYHTVSYEVEMLAVLSMILFSPEYLDLYSLKTMHYFDEQRMDKKTMLANSVHPKLTEEILIFYEKLVVPYSKKMPLFLPNTTFTRLWTKHFLSQKNIKLYLLHLLFFFYWKYRYRLIDKLPFTHHHDWQH
ncbi:MAG TPA: nucleotidyltransferase family protein [Candidatus Saccharimonadales bacterium]|nr:nucleotidyltransferase family protein [Candidatus Saccharimonadales bacterium]